MELFRDASSPAASVRARQGAILFDQIGFERGAFDVTVTSGGVSEFWRRAEHLSDEEIADARRLHEEGAPFALLMGKQPERGVAAPPEAMRPVIAGDITRHYVAEWESVIRELEPLEPDWAGAFAITDIDLREHGLDREIGQRNFAVISERLRAGPDHHLRDWLYRAFNRDAVVAEHQDAVFNVTGLFLPALEREGVETVVTGHHALEIVAPNLADTPWEKVFEFRDHPGCQEARAKLREFEQRTLDSEPESDAEFQKGLGQDITRDLMLAWSDTRPSMGLDVARQGLNLGADVLVPGISTVTSLIETKREQRRHDRSWRTALMRLSL